MKLLTGILMGLIGALILALIRPEGYALPAVMTFIVLELHRRAWIYLDRGVKDERN